MFSSHKLLKISSWILIVAFIVQDLAWAVPDGLPVTIATTPVVLRLPEELGRVAEIHRAPGATKTLYVIQDAHTNESAQKNIAGILDTLIEKEKIKYVFLEAGTGDDSLSSLRPLAPAEARKAAADKFLKKAWIQGPDYLDLTSEKPIQLWGVEDKALYFRGIELYRTLVKEREHANAYLDKFDRALGTLKPRLFNPALLESDAQRTAHLAGELPVTGYFEFLSTQAGKQGISILGYPALMALKEVREKESRIDFKKANEEMQKVFLSLRPEEKAAFAEAMKKQGRPGQSVEKLADIYVSLKSKIKDPAACPEFLKYTDYLSAMQKVEDAAFLAELDALEARLSETLTTNDAERALLGSGRSAEILRRLVNLQAGSADIQALNEKPSSFSATEIAGYLNGRLMQLQSHYEDVIFLDNEYEAAFAAAKEFYALTEKRDDVFINNVLQKMSDEKQEKAAFVAGGFHAENLQTKLREKGISYVSILPRVLQETNQKKYENLLLSQSVPSEAMDASKLWNTLPAAEMQVIQNNKPTFVKNSLLREFRRTEDKIPAPSLLRSPSVSSAGQAFEARKASVEGARLSTRQRDPERIVDATGRFTYRWQRFDVGRRYVGQPIEIRPMDSEAERKWFDERVKLGDGLVHQSFPMKDPLSPEDKHGKFEAWVSGERILLFDLSSGEYLKLVEKRTYSRSGGFMIGSKPYTLNTSFEGREVEIKITDRGWDAYVIGVLLASFDAKTDEFRRLYDYRRTDAKGRFSFKGVRYTAGVKNASKDVILSFSGAEPFEAYIDYEPVPVAILGARLADTRRWERLTKLSTAAYFILWGFFLSTITGRQQGLRQDNVRQELRSGTQQNGVSFTPRRDHQYKDSLKDRIKRGDADALREYHSNFIVGIDSRAGSKLYAENKEFFRNLNIDPFFKSGAFEGNERAFRALSLCAIFENESARRYFKNGNIDYFLKNISEGNEDQFGHLFQFANYGNVRAMEFFRTFDVESISKKILQGGADADVDPLYIFTAYGNKAAKDALVSTLVQGNHWAWNSLRLDSDGEVLRLRAAHLQERISFDELSKRLDGMDPPEGMAHFLYASYVSRENFGDLAKLIFEKLRRLARDAGYDLSSYLKKLDPEKKSYFDFILQSANFNQINELLSSPQATREVMDALFRDLPKSDLEDYSTRLAIFVENVLGDGTFANQRFFQTYLRELYDTSDGLNRQLVAALLTVYGDKLTFLDKNDLADIAQESKVQTDPISVSYRDIVKHGKITAHIVFADADAVQGHYPATIRYFKGKGYKQISSTGREAVLEKDDIRLVLIVDDENKYEIQEHLDSAGIVISRSHAGREGAVFKFQPNEVASRGLIFIASACRSATVLGALSKSYPGAQFIGATDIAEGAKTNAITYYLLEALHQRMDTYDKIRASILRHFPGGINYVLPGDKPFQVSRHIAELIARSSAGARLAEGASSSGKWIYFTQAAVLAISAVMLLLTLIVHERMLVGEWGAWLDDLYYSYVPRFISHHGTNLFASIIMEFLLANSLRRHSVTLVGIANAVMEVYVFERNGLPVDPMDIGVGLGSALVTYAALSWSGVLGEEKTSGARLADEKDDKDYAGLLQTIPAYELHAVLSKLTAGKFYGSGVLEDAIYYNNEEMGFFNAATPGETARLIDGVVRRIRETLGKKFNKIYLSVLRTHEGIYLETEPRESERDEGRIRLRSLTEFQKKNEVFWAAVEYYHFLKGEIAPPLNRSVSMVLNHFARRESEILLSVADDLHPEYQSRYNVQLDPTTSWHIANILWNAVESGGLPSSSDGARLAEKKPPQKRSLVERVISERAAIAELHRTWPAAVGVFGSARMKDDHPYYAFGVELGEVLWKNGMIPRTGAGPSLMEAPFLGYVRARSEAGVMPSPTNMTQGIEIELPWEQETNPYTESHIKLDDFITRKIGLHEKLQGVVALPGGFGTLDEIFEVWRRGRPTVLVREEFWRPIFDAFFSSWKKAGLLSQVKQRGKIRYSDSPTEAIAILQRESKKQPPYSTSEAELTEINREVDEGLQKIKALPRSVTFVGKPRPGRESHIAGELAEKLIQENKIPVRVASRGVLLNAVARNLLQKGYGDFLSAVLFMPKSGKLSPTEQRIQRSIYLKDESNHQLLLANNSYAYVFTPGGVGTMNKLFDLAVIMQTQKVHKKPIILIGEEFWPPILDAMERQFLVEDPSNPGFYDAAGVYPKVSMISPEDRDLFIVVKNAEEAQKAIVDFGARLAASTQSLLSGQLEDWIRSGRQDIEWQTTTFGKVRARLEIDRQFENDDQIRIMVRPDQAWAEANPKLAAYLVTPKNKNAWTDRLMPNPGTLGQMLVSPWTDIASMEPGKALLIREVQERRGYRDIPKKGRQELDLWRDEVIKLLSEFAAQHQLSLFANTWENILPTINEDRPDYVEPFERLNWTMRSLATRYSSNEKIFWVFPGASDPVEAQDASGTAEALAAGIAEKTVRLYEALRGWRANPVFGSALMEARRVEALEILAPEGQVPQAPTEDRLIALMTHLSDLLWRSPGRNDRTFLEEQIFRISDIHEMTIRRAQKTGMDPDTVEENRLKKAVADLVAEMDMWFVIRSRPGSEEAPNPFVARRRRVLIKQLMDAKKTLRRWVEKEGALEDDPEARKTLEDILDYIVWDEGTPSWMKASQTHFLETSSWVMDHFRRPGSGARLADRVLERLKEKDVRERKNIVGKLLFDAEFSSLREEIALLALMDPDTKIRKQVADWMAQGGKGISISLEVLSRHLAEPVKESLKIFNGIPYGPFDEELARRNKRYAILFALSFLVKQGKLDVKDLLEKEAQQWTADTDMVLERLAAQKFVDDTSFGTERPLTLLEALRLVRLRDSLKSARTSELWKRFRLGKLTGEKKRMKDPAAWLHGAAMAVAAGLKRSSQGYRIFHARPRRGWYSRGGLSVIRSLEKILLVDGNNIPTGQTKDITQAHVDGDWHRVSQVLGIHPKSGKLVLQRRSDDVMNFPGMLDLFGGHNGKGEDELSTALKEARQEFHPSIQPEQLILVEGRGAFKYEKARNREFRTLYLLALTDGQLADIEKKNEELKTYNGLPDDQRLAYKQTVAKARGISLEKMNDEFEVKEYLLYGFDELLSAHGADPSDFADGLRGYLENPDHRRILVDSVRPYLGARMSSFAKASEDKSSEAREASVGGRLARDKITSFEELTDETGVYHPSDATIERIPEGALTRRYALSPEEMRSAYGVQKVVRNALQGWRQKPGYAHTDNHTYYGIYAPAEIGRALSGLKIAGVNGDSTLLDLGHGEGILSHAIAAVLGAEVTGVEANAVFYNRSVKAHEALLKVKESSARKVRLLNQDFLRVPWNDFDFVYYYSYGSRSKRELAMKAAVEMKPGAKFILFGERDKDSSDTHYDDTVVKTLLDSGRFILSRYPEYGTWVFEKTGARLAEKKNMEGKLPLGAEWMVFDAREGAHGGKIYQVRKIPENEYYRIHPYNEGGLARLAEFFPRLAEQLGIRSVGGEMEWPDVDEMNGILKKLGINVSLVTVQGEITPLEYIRWLDQRKIPIAHDGYEYFHDMGLHFIPLLLMFTTPETSDYLSSQVKATIELYEKSHAKGDSDTAEKISRMLAANLDAYTADISYSILAGDWSGSVYQTLEGALSEKVRRMTYLAGERWSAETKDEPISKQQIPSIVERFSDILNYGIQADPAVGARMADGDQPVYRIQSSIDISQSAAWQAVPDIDATLLDLKAAGFSNYRKIGKVFTKMNKNHSFREMMEKLLISDSQGQGFGFPVEGFDTPDFRNKDQIVKLRRSLAKKIWMTDEGEERPFKERVDLIRYIAGAQAVTGARLAVSEEDIRAKVKAELSHSPENIRGILWSHERSVGLVILLNGDTAVVGSDQKQFMDALSDTISLADMSLPLEGDFEIPVTMYLIPGKFHHKIKTYSPDPDRPYLLDWQIAARSENDEAVLKNQIEELIEKTFFGARLGEIKSVPTQEISGSRLPALSNFKTLFLSFLIGVALAQPSVSKAEIPLRTDLAGPSAVYQYIKEGDRVTARSNGETVTADISNKAVTERRTERSVTAENTVSLSDIKMKVDGVTQRVSAALETAGLSRGLPVIVDIDLGFIEGESFEAYARNLTAEIRALKKRDPKAFFRLTGKENLVQNILDMPRAQGVFMQDIPEDLANAARVNLFSPEISSVKEGSVNLPAQHLDEDAPAFQAMLQLAVALGRVDARNMPSEVLDAWSTLSGNHLNTQTAGDIADGKADLATMKLYSLKPVLEKVGEYLRYMALRLRQLGQSA